MGEKVGMEREGDAWREKGGVGEVVLDLVLVLVLVMFARYT